MIDKLVFAPVVPWQLIATFEGLSILMFAFVVVRHGMWPLWWFLASFVITLALVDPRLVREDLEIQKNIVLVLVDRTASQSVGKRKNLTNKALSHLREQLKRFPKIELRVETVHDVVPQPQTGIYNEGTLMMRSLRRALDALPAGRLSGVVLISDGQVHDMSEEITESFSSNTPIHLLLTGNRDQKDRRIVVEQAPSYGLVGKEVVIEYRVDERMGAKARRNSSGLAQVTLRQGEKVLSKVQTPIGHTNSFKVHLTHAGPTVLTLEVASVPGELSTVNNETLVRINGVRDRLRVLLVSGQPHAGERAWRNLLKSDPSVDLVHFTILRPPEKDDFTPLDEIALIAFPTRELFEQKLKEFDLLVFDRYVVRNVLPTAYFRNIEDYVKGGGALLLAVGPEYAKQRSLFSTPLRQLLPAKPTGKVIKIGFRPMLTKIGRRHPVTGNLPGQGKMAEDGAITAPTWGRWFRQVETSARTAHTLMQSPSLRPLLVLKQYGEGRVAVILSDHIWLWSRGFEGGGPYAELLRRSAHWLMKEPELEAENLWAEIKDGVLIVQRRSLSDTPSAITVHDPGGKKTKYSIKPTRHGLTRFEVPINTVGLYRISDGSRNTLAATGTINPIEFADLRSTEHILSPLVKKTGGGFFWLKLGLPDVRMVRSDRDRAGKGWFGMVENKPYVINNVTQTPLLPPEALILLILATIMTAWWHEGRQLRSS